LQQELAKNHFYRLVTTLSIGQYIISGWNCNQRRLYNGILMISSLRPPSNHHVRNSGYIGFPGIVSLAESQILYLNILQ